MDPQQPAGQVAAAPLPHPWRTSFRVFACSLAIGLTSGGQFASPADSLGQTRTLQFFSERNTPTHKTTRETRKKLLSPTLLPTVSADPPPRGPDFSNTTTDLGGGGVGMNKKPVLRARCRPVGLLPASTMPCGEVLVHKPRDVHGSHARLDQIVLACEVRHSSSPERSRPDPNHLTGPIRSTSQQALERRWKGGEGSPTTPQKMCAFVHTVVRRPGFS